MVKTGTKPLIYTGNESLFEYLTRIFQHKSLIRTFVVRELKVKYSQTYLGILWSIIQAVIGITIISIFFGYLMKVDTGEIPYPVFAFPGMMAWYFFSFAIAFSGSSLVVSQELVQKVSFPKILLPISYTIFIFVDFIIWMALLLLMLVLFGQPLTLKILIAPVFMLLNLLTSLSISLWLSALTVRSRDLLIIIPYIIGFGIFITPVFYPETMVPEQFSWILYLNPAAGVIEGLRWSLLGSDLPSIKYIFGFIPFAVLFIAGLFYFKKIEGTITDKI